MAKPLAKPLTFAEIIAQRVIASGAKALGRAMESVLEDVGGAADSVSAKTRQGREQIQSVGMGRPKPQRARRRKRAHDEEDE
jgi:hypothetical protein